MWFLNTIFAKKITKRRKMVYKFTQFCTPNEVKRCIFSIKGIILPSNSKASCQHLPMSSLSHKNHNPLGSVFFSLSKEKKKKIRQYANELKPSLGRNIKQYMYYARRENPAKLEPRLQQYMINIDERFSICFIPNCKADHSMVLLETRVRFVC